MTDSTPLLSDEPAKSDATLEPARYSGVPVVGIGASAGGLEALDQFLRNVPADSGLAYVVVQHLDPDHKGFLVSLLQRATPMPVAEISDSLPPLPDHVYVIAPGRDLVLLQGMLVLVEPNAPRGLRLPIDRFLRSLADEVREKAVGVILSGMGSDGTLGLRTMKESGGAVFVQEPGTAKFDGMPSSAIRTGLVDVVASAEELPLRILRLMESAPVVAARHAAGHSPDHYPPGDDPDSLAKIVLLLRERTGHDFSLYRKSTLVRRIERRVALHNLPSITNYLRLLEDSRPEATHLFQELLIGVTSFFRDPAVWEQLRLEDMPRLLTLHPKGEELRAWVPACSTGEEAYGLAMVFTEALEAMAHGARAPVLVFATDLDKSAVDIARSGVYSVGMAADVGEARLNRFFVEDRDGYRVAREIRQKVMFATQNVAMDPPFTRLDFISCRNLLIYLEPELQKKLIALFHYCLRPGGLLLLGSAETIGSAADLFRPVSGKARLYQRLPGPAQNQAGALSPIFVAGRAPVGAAAADSGLRPYSGGKTLTPTILKRLADDVLLQRFAPPAVLTTPQGNVVYISGKTGKYLEPAVGNASLDLIAMARPGLDQVLADGFRRALRENVPVDLRAVKVQGDDGDQWVDVRVRVLAEPSALKGMAMVVFDTSTPPPHSVLLLDGAAPAEADSRRVAALQEELLRAHEEVRTVREAMRDSQEDLKATNEELQSANEELQSINEELNTSREEMQSMNEELQTLNHELVARVDELVHNANDMDNLFNSTDLPTLFLDTDLRVRRYTASMTKLFKLIPSDVGRPVTDLVSQLNYPELAGDAREVMRNLMPRTREVSRKGGGWFAARLLTYRTLDHRIDGVVVTVSDIGAAKALEASLREAERVLAHRVAGQDAELEAAKVLERVLREAQALLETRVDRQRIVLDRISADLTNESGPRDAPPT